MLAGDNALDLPVIFDVSEPYYEAIFIEVLTDWILKTNIRKMENCGLHIV